LFSAFPPTFTPLLCIFLLVVVTKVVSYPILVIFINCVYIWGLRSICSYIDAVNFQVRYGPHIVLYICRYMYLKNRDHDPFWTAGHAADD
jgi:hypothetical protein